MARKTLTDRGVASLKAKPKLYSHPDPQLPGHYIRVTPTGTKSYVAVARNPNGKQVWTTVGSAALIKIDDAREKAREIIVRVKGGQRVEGPQSFEAVANEWLQRHVEAKGLISAAAIRGRLRNHVLPVWAGRDFESIKRSDLAALIDRVSDTAGPVAADHVLTTISSVCNWYAARHDTYMSPVVRGMTRTSKKERARTRILDDNEIRLVWNACEGTFGDFVKVLLLTAQRRDKVASIKWDDVGVDGTWSVKNGVKREKGTGGDLVLPPIAIDIIRSRPRLASNPYVFAGRAGTHFMDYQRPKVTLDKATGEIPHWTLHDLRRTARSLMSRAGVQPHISERVLGHVIDGVEGIYDRHAYKEEKGQALKMLAGLVENILHGDSDTKVRRLRG
jgi:integrase